MKMSIRKVISSRVRLTKMKIVSVKNTKVLSNTTQVSLVQMRPSPLQNTAAAARLNDWV